MTQHLARLTPAVTATYLVHAGWARMGERNAGTVWTKPLDGGVSHLFQPEDPASPDYAPRVGEMIAALAVIEGRTEADVLADLCAGDHASQPVAENRRTATRTDWMEPEYGLRQPEVALVLDLAAGRVERGAFVLELERLLWPRHQADELADLVGEMLAATSASATARPGEVRQSVAGSPATGEPRPAIVCLCGSGRFRTAFEEAEFNETLAGRIVLPIGCNTKDVARDVDWQHVKPMLDELHLRKIDLADEVLIVNVGGYIGESTRRELAYARAHGKYVRFLEQSDGLG